MDVNRVLALATHLEVAVQNAHWRSQSRVQRVKVMRDRQRKSLQEVGSPPRATVARVVGKLSRRGVGIGNILVVHSDDKASCEGSKPRDESEALKALVDDTGTVVRTAIPSYGGARVGIERMNGGLASLAFDYDPATTPAWNGVLPNELMKVPGARRSSHPLNAVIAWGPAAEVMLCYDLTGQRQMACGPTSSWNCCREHVAEDVLGERWPVPGWYQDRRFRIKTPQEREEHTVRDRHPRRLMHCADRTLEKDLLRARLLTVGEVDQVPIGSPDAGPLVPCLNRRNSAAYPYYLVPLRR